MVEAEVKIPISRPDNFVARAFDFFKKNKKELILLCLILGIGAFFRLYRINEYMTFLGDEGRDVIIVRRLLVFGDPILIGPGTSVGNMYLGPLYYYMMGPALFLANFSPVGPAIQIALLGIITIFFIWWAGRVWWGRLAGILAAFLYAISPTIIIYSRSSWNPNIMPFFALLSIYSIWKVWERSAWKWLIVLGVSYAFVLQSHYLGLLLAPTLFLFWLLTFRKIRGSIKESRIFLKNSIFGLLTFIALMSPLVIFDIRHGWINSTAMLKFFSTKGGVSVYPLSSVSKIYPIVEKVGTSLLAGRNEIFGKWLTILAILFVLVLIFLKFAKRRNILTGASFLILSWLALGLVGLTFYKQEIYDHYFGFIFPAPFLLIGYIGSSLEKSRTQLLKYLFIVFYLFLISASLLNSPIRAHPTFQLQRSEAVAKVIKEKADGKRFNLATISDRNNRDVYQYFLELWGTKIVDTDPQKAQFTVTDQLFVVCEKPRKDCDPVHDPSAWIANFGWTKVEDEWEVWGGTLFKLVHTK